jgi:hypothetical protein
MVDGGGKDMSDRENWGFVGEGATFTTDDEHMHAPYDDDLSPA